ncbi:hypothetical protein [Lysobacter capsici]|uniref:hypothetical protein n=1 Tax=Lysobacter capsici TaxID=435897 RepID=UPI001F265B22|nr:hypothetical protein [Lysobacter capsici]
MTLVGHSVSDTLDYVFHIDSARRFGRTGKSTRISCRFAAHERADCRLGELDSAHGDASDDQDLCSRTDYVFGLSFELDDARR